MYSEAFSCLMFHIITFFLIVTKVLFLAMWLKRWRVRPSLWSRLKYHSCWVDCCSILYRYSWTLMTFGDPLAFPLAPPSGWHLARSAAAASHTHLHGCGVWLMKHEQARQVEHVFVKETHCSVLMTFSARWLKCERRVQSVIMLFGLWLPCRIFARVGNKLGPLCWILDRRGAALPSGVLWAGQKNLRAYIPAPPWLSSPLAAGLGWACSLSGSLNLIIPGITVNGWSPQGCFT